MEVQAGVTWWVMGRRLSGRRARVSVELSLGDTGEVTLRVKAPAFPCRAGLPRFGQGRLRAWPS